MEKEIPTYFAGFDPNVFGSGIDLIAITETPAIEEYALRFSNAKEYEFKFELNHEKQMIVGPIMIPDKRIYRNENGLEFNIVFTKETIAAMVDKFQSENRDIKLNFNHDSNRLVKGFLSGIWVVEDSTKDKSAFYGYELPVGSAFIEAKITDPKEWEIVKSMNQVGFSVEGLMKALGMNFNKVETKTNKTEMNKTKKVNFLAKLTKTKKKFNMTLKTFDEVTTSDNIILIVSALEEGATVEMLNDAQEVVAADNGTYVLPNEKVEIVVVDGKITAVNEMVVEEMSTETPVVEAVIPAAVTEEVKLEETPVVETKMAIEPEVLAKFVELETRVEALEAIINEYNSKQTMNSNTNNDNKAKRFEALMALTNHKNK